MIKENSPIEFALGVNNFRREYTGTVNTLTQIPPINTVIESLTDPKTFNTRFKQLSESIKFAYNAVGDIAIRDKRYLETFLTGYTNPFVTQSFKYANPELRKNVDIYDPNGNPIKFPEDRIAYTIDFTGSVNFNSVFEWVFLDGKLADKSDYTIINTAYGLRCFVKASEITPNMEVTVVLNRLFNTSGKYQTEIKVAAAANKFSALFPVDKFGTFYDVRYLKATVEVPPASERRTIPDRNVKFELDVTGNTVRMDIADYPLAAGAIIKVSNTICPWNISRQITTATSKSWDTRVLLFGEPVAYKTTLDFDVFLDGYKLIPFKHFNVIEDGDNISNNASYLELNCERIGTTSNHKIFRVDIFKNEASGYRDGADIAHEDKLDCSGVYIRPVDTSKMPFMTRIGHGTIGGRYIPNIDIQALQRSVLLVNNERNEFKDFAFQSRVVRTTDISAILDHSKRNLSEFDLALQAVGEKQVLANYKALHPCSNVPNPKDITIEERFAQWLTWPTGKTQADMANLDDVLKTRTNKNETLVLDANGSDTLLNRPELAIFFNSGLLIDANQEMNPKYYGKGWILDANEEIV